MLKSLSQESKVGSYLLLGLLTLLGIAWLVGVFQPFSSKMHLFVTYDFAGGIEIGSPVRVSGIKVGRVEKIQFFAPSNPKQPALKLELSISKEANSTLRQDSKFFINLAGIIGERYIEITPGHDESAQLTEGETLRGVDPPRIDQLISQSFDLAGKVKEILDENQAEILGTIKVASELSKKLKQTLDWIHKTPLAQKDLNLLIHNLALLSTEAQKFTEKAKDPELEKTLKLLHDLVWRLEPLNADTFKKFFQKDGVKVRLF